MTTDQDSSAQEVVARLQRAMNDKNIEAFVACFAEDYDSEQPAHPARAFRGADQVRKNWSSIFSSMPSLRADLRAVAVAGETVMSEWDWTGTQADGGPFNWRGVIVMGVRESKIQWGRLYMEPVEAGADIDETVRRMTGTAGS